MERDKFQTQQWVAGTLILVIVMIVVVILVVSLATPHSNSNTSMSWQRCETNSDCPTNYPYCDEARQCAECLSDSNCGRGFKCSNKRCVELPQPTPCIEIEEPHHLQFEVIEYMSVENPIGQGQVYIGVNIKVTWSGHEEGTLYVSDTPVFTIVRSSHQTQIGEAHVTAPIGSTLYYQVTAEGCGGPKTSVVQSFTPSLPLDIALRCYVSYYAVQQIQTGELYYNGPGNDFGVESTVVCGIEHGTAGCQFENFGGNRLVPLANQSYVVGAGAYLTAEPRTVPIPTSQQVLFVQPVESWYDNDYSGLLMNQGNFYEYNGILWANQGSNITAWLSAGASGERTSVYFGSA